MAFQIQIPADYFARSAQKDYADDAGLALIREFTQNACDAGATRVAFSFAPDNTLVVEDNGSGCDDRRMRNKLLVPLESEKEGDSVGGFGKAKELLLFGNSRWVLRTRDLRVEGSLLTVESYEQGLPSFAGFRAEVTLPEGLYRAARENARRFLRRSERPGVTWVLDGEVIDCEVRRAMRCTKDFGFAKAFVRRGVTDSNIYLRTRGLLTAIRWGHHSGDVGQVIIEVTAPSTEVLTPARDWFRAHEQRRAVEGWMNDLVVAARQTLADDVGDELLFHDFSPAPATPRAPAGRPALPAVGGTVVVPSFTAAAPSVEELAQALAEFAPVEQAALAPGGVLTVAPAQPAAQRRRRTDGFDLALLPRVAGVENIVVHTGGKKQARKATRWLRSHRVSAERLLAGWAEAVFQVGAANGLVVDCVGFTFSSEAEAEFVRASNGRFGALLNPTTLRRGAADAAEELRDRALHEAAHQVSGTGHDESFVLAEFRLRRSARAKGIIRAIKSALKSGAVTKKGEAK